MAEKNELLQRIGRVGARIDPGLSERDVERLVVGALSRRTRRTRLRGAGLVVAIAAGGWFAVAQRRPARDVVRVAELPTVAASSGTAGPPLRFTDGSIARAADDRAAITVREDSAARVTVELSSGRERFEVVPGLPREFVVRAGDVTVTVLGTVFSVERIADRVGVSVERGQVKVDWGLGRRTLTVGESAWFPPLLVRRETPVAAASAPRSVAAAPVPRSVAAVPAPRSVAAVPRTAWAVPPVSRSGAPPLIAPSPSASPLPESAAHLLSAADEARLAGRTREGAALLRRLLDDHRSDPRAPFAAFTLGRMLLMELGEPRAAAAAFSEARTLAPDGPLAEDALAREAEAWAKAGDRERARARAHEYLRLHPEGRRVEAVKALGE